MTAVTIHTQAELDAALADAAETIHIESAAGVWLVLTGSDSSHVEARGSSRVVAWDSSHVEARGSSRVEAWDSSRVVAWDSSHVVAWDSSRVEARGSSRVEARGSSRVVAWGSSRVEAWGSSRVEAWGSSRVVAWDSSHVEARGSSRVEASRYVAVHLHSGRATVASGVLIDLTELDLTDPQQWADYVGAKPDSDGNVVLYKAVDANLLSDHGMAYPSGETVTAPDWRDDHACGGGLHVSPHPSQARAYTKAGWDARFLACRVALADVRSIGTDKCKVPSLLVLREVDEWGDPVTAAEAVAS